MKICKKWQDLGWKEATSDFYSESYRRVHNGKTQLVCRTLSRTMWRAIQYNEQDTPISDVLYPTASKALSSLNVS